MSSRRVFLGVMAIVFAASAAKTIDRGASMAAMGEMPMPGGWSMSHMWMLMPGQTLSGATASFVGMWVVMMVAMMLPSLTPMLLRYRESMGGTTGTVRASLLATLVALGYFAVWSAVGACVFPLGVLVADVAMRNAELAEAVPAAAGIVVLTGGIVQRTAWSARQLTLCRQQPRGRLTPSVGGALRYGLCLGLHCCRACAGLTVAALAVGVMDLRVMAAITVAVTVGRLSPNDVRTSRASRGIGAVAAALGLAMIVHARLLA